MSSASPLAWLEQRAPRSAAWAERLGRLLFPPHCAVCGRANAEDEDRYLCRDCINRIDFVLDPCCPRCGHELGPHVDAGPRCLECSQVPLRFNRAVAAAHHEGAARDLVLGLKFASQSQHVIPMGKLLLARLEETPFLDKIEVIIPVPLHRARRRSRGFNQSELIALELGRRAGLPVPCDNLVRTVDTPPQTRAMSLASRRANVKGAFAVRRPARVAGKTILLIDDVLTTGATTSECAGTLKRAGASAVFVATVTRRMKTPPLDVPAGRPVRYEVESVTRFLK